MDYSLLKAFTLIALSLTLSGYDFILVDRISAPAEILPSFTEKMLYVPSAFSYQANDMPLDVAPCRYLRHHPRITALTKSSSSTEALMGAASERQSLRRQCQARVDVGGAAHTTGLSACLPACCLLAVCLLAVCLLAVCYAHYNGA